MTVWRICLITALAANAGCGFYMRGSRALDLEFNNVYVASQGADSLIAELRKQLGYGGVTVVRTPSTAEAVINISNESVDRRVLSVDPRSGKVREFEIGYEVEIEVTGKNGKTLLEHETITFMRDYTFDESAVLGKYEEERILREELRRDAAGTVVRRLQAIQKE